MQWLFIRRDENDPSPYSAWNITGTYKEELEGKIPETKCQGQHQQPNDNNRTKKTKW
uniref:Uncharacterized protein n=1 Tax=Nelumbo nucifera TaxID=4432 RepID=A0A822XHM8_NELNU|nr:TPA_asm: hypothetical protein HUJ06_022447 [Nelumbo nucifera]